MITTSNKKSYGLHSMSYYLRFGLVYLTKRLGEREVEGLSEQVRNDFIRGVEKKLEVWLTQEVVEKAEREAAEKATAEAAAREAAEKVTVEAATRAKAEVEAVMVVEASQKTVEVVEKTNEVALTQGESSTTDIAHLIIKIMEELQKEHQLVRVKLDKQDQVNSGIQSLLTEFFQKMPPTPNPQTLQDIL